MKTLITLALFLTAPTSFAQSQSTEMTSLGSGTARLLQVLALPEVKKCMDEFNEGDTRVLDVLVHMTSDTEDYSIRGLSFDQKTKTKQDREVVINRGWQLVASPGGGMHGTSVTTCKVLLSQAVKYN